MMKISPFVFWCFTFQMICLVGFLVKTELNEYAEGSMEGYGAAVIGALYREYLDIHVMIFVGFGFLMTFLHKYGYSALSYNFAVSVLILQWGILMAGFGSSVFPSDPDAPSEDKSGIDASTLFAGDFSAAAALITLGAILGRVSPTQTLVVVFIEGVIFSLVGHYCYNELQIADIGGTITIHLFGCYFGIGAAWALGPKRANNHDDNGSTKLSDVFSMIGTLFLFVFWPSFVGALGTGNSRNRAILNTVLSLCGSTLSTFWCSHLFRDGKFNMVDIQNATLSGGVSIGAIGNMVIGPGGSLATGIITGIVSTAGYTWIQPFLANKLKIIDTCGVNNLHGMPAIIGAIASVVAAAMVTKENYGGDDGITEIFPAMPEKSAGWQATQQFSATIVTFVVALVTGVATGFLVKLKIFDPYNEETPLFDDAKEFNVPEHYAGGKTYEEKIDALFLKCKTIVGKKDQYTI